MKHNNAMDSLRAELVSRRDALRAALQGDLTALRALTLASGDIADFALDTAQDEVTSQIAEVESLELQQIDEALARIQSGAYGECNDCGKNIPQARLEALPYATLCIKCQTKAEQAGSRIGYARR